MGLTPVVSPMTAAVAQSVNLKRTDMFPPKKAPGLGLINKMLRSSGFTRNLLYDSEFIF